MEVNVAGDIEKVVEMIIGIFWNKNIEEKEEKEEEEEEVKMPLGTNTPMIFCTIKSNISERHRILLR